MEIVGIAKTSASSQWALHSDNNDMTLVTKNPQDARELKVHTAGEGDSLVQRTFGQKQGVSKYASEVNLIVCLKQIPYKTQLHANILLLLLYGSALRTNNP